MTSTLSSNPRREDVSLQISWQSIQPKHFRFIILLAIACFALLFYLCCPHEVQVVLRDHVVDPLSPLTAIQKFHTATERANGTCL